MTSPALKIASMFLFFCFSELSTAALFSIAKPTFCGYVNPNSLVISAPEDNGKIRRSLLAGNLLHFYCVIIGDESTFQYLSDHRHLELHAHIWADGIRYDSVEFGISTREWERNKEGLKAELDEMGFFTFRTYMNTKKTWFSEIELILKDDDSKIVSPLGFPGSYRARVKLHD